MAPVSSQSPAAWVKVGGGGGADLHHQKWVVGVDSTFWGWGFGESWMLLWFLRQVHGEVG